LEVLLCIIKGIEKLSNNNYSIFEKLLIKVLIPLHAPNDMVEWRDQIPVIQEYHSPLIKMIQTIMEKQKDTKMRFNAFIITINELLSMWPQGYEANTPKELLLLHEIEKLLECSSIDEFKVVHKALIDRISKSVGSETDNIRTMQKTLQMFRNEKIINILKSDPDIKRYVIYKLVPALYRDGILTWNPTVNKMTGLALKKLKEMDEETFMKYAEKIKKSTNTMNTMNKDKECVFEASTKNDGNESLPKKSRSSINAMIPPVIKQHSNEFEKPLLPPKPITNMPRPLNKTNDFKNATTLAWKPGSGPPPVTITGVAPWALGSQAKSITPPLGIHAVFPKSESKHFQAEKLQSLKDDVDESSADSGIILVMEYIDKCLPKSNDDGGDGIKEWNKLQSAPTPTLLPSMRFHDLVFGKNLGSGSFSSVRYARQIIREKSRDFWPEFAVKVISTATIIEKNYYLPTIREIAILQLLSHPGIARLISSFQYNNSAYLVLEYAARGDLHSYLLKMGPLSHLQTRFIVGEVAAAITSIHELGFSYNDLKPENLLITEQGHVKVADFGACRPITSEATQILKESKNILVNLRNGDWKDISTDFIDSAETGIDTSALDEDIRFEGTPAYLPPEVLLNQVKTFNTSVDAWALGCLTYFCLNGQPPFYGDGQQVISQIFRNKEAKVNFILDEMDIEDKDEAIAVKDECAQNFMNSLMCVDVDNRLRFEDVVVQDYLTCGHDAEIATSEQILKLEPKKLHLKDPIHLPILSDEDKGNEGQDKEWARRQLSVLWAPMPSDNLETLNTDGDFDETPCAYKFDTILETNKEENIYFS